MSVIPLQVMSTYSLLQSTIRPAELVKTAKSRGYQAVSITDLNVLYGVIDFYNAAQKNGIKPLIGLRITPTISVSDGRRLDLLLFAKNDQGYQSLMNISTRKMVEFENTDISLAEIADLLNNIIVVINPNTTILGSAGDPTVTSLLNKLKGNLQDDVYLGVNPEIGPSGLENIVRISRESDIGLVADESVEYLNSDDQFATRILTSIATNQTITDPVKQAQVSGSHYLKNATTTTAPYHDINLQEAVENNRRIVQKVDVHLKFIKPVLPHFKTPDGFSSAEYLRNLCIQGLKQRQAAPGVSLTEYRERLNRELTVIHEMGFDDYFLIVWDIMRFIHQSKITSGPGRGSAAGSLVAYALAITDVDPLKYHLLFERFLNPERAQMPDIDLDIPDNRRQDVLKYVHQKYGHKRVAQIITFGTLASRQVIRDVSRVFALPQYQVDNILELVRRAMNGKNKSIQELLRDSLPLSNLISDDPVVATLFKVAVRLEGLPRHYSTHAAGVVLSADDLNKIVPLQNGNDDAGMVMTQFPKEDVEELGLLKMDFLGLRNLSIMDMAVNLVRQKDASFDVTKISLDDPKTINHFKRGLTDGIFQFESTGIRQTLRKLQVDSFEDVVAVNALYRPGPLENIPHFIARKHGQERVNLPDSSLKPILGPTYGILVYQEQVMQVASLMAGFSLGQADLLRRAMSKKKQAVMESMRTRFIKGAVNNGYQQSTAEQVFDYIDRFANYGFNRSHAVAYSKMAFEMAYLKVHYPAEFFTALLTIEPNMTKEVQHFQDAKRFGVDIKSPAINLSLEQFTLNNGEIICGFSMIKGMRRDFSAAIVKERGNGPFHNLPDFLARMDEKWRKKNLIIPLIYSGAFDGLGYNRAEMVDGLDGLLEGSQFIFKSADLQPVINRRQEYPLSFRLSKEREYLGVYVSGHPVSQYGALRQQINGRMLSSLKSGEKVSLLVLINRVNQIFTKKKHQPMAFLTVSDESGEISVTVFPNQYQRYNQLLKRGTIIAISGSVEERNGDLQVVADNIVAADNIRQSPTTVSNHQKFRWVIRVIDDVSWRSLKPTFDEEVRNIVGNVPVIIYDQKAQSAVQTNWRLSKDEKTREILNKLFGSQNVVLQEIQK